MATIKLSGAVTVGGSGGGGSYTLPTASTTVLGGVKVDGTSVTISNGVISAQGGGAGSQITNTDGSNTYSTAVTDTGIVTMTTARGGIEFGAQPEVGAPSHLHIMRSSTDASSNDLYFGDDYNFLKQPYNGGVVIGTYEPGTETSVSEWSFGTDGTTRMPAAADGQLSIKGTRKSISGWPVAADLNTLDNVVIYYPSSQGVFAFKMTLRIEHTRNGVGIDTEIMEITAARGVSDIKFSISGRVNTYGSQDSVINVGLDNDNMMTVEVTPGYGDRHLITYDVTEFNISND